MAWFAGTLVITTKNLCSFFVNFMPSDVFNGPTHCLKMTVFTRKRPWKIVTTKRTSVLDRFREGAFLANFRARHVWFWLVEGTFALAIGERISRIYNTHVDFIVETSLRVILTLENIYLENTFETKSVQFHDANLVDHKLVTVDEIKYWILANCLQYCCITINNLTESPIIVGKN